MRFSRPTGVFDVPWLQGGLGFPTAEHCVVGADMSNLSPVGSCMT